MTKRTPRIGIIGLGGVGAAYVAQAQDNGFDIEIICDAGRKARYESADITVNGKPYRFRFLSQPEPQAPMDLILISVKFHQLKDALETLRPFVTSETILVSLLNGISSEEVIARQLQTSNVVYAFVVATDGQRVGYQYQYSQKGKIVFGVIPPGQTKLLEDARNFLLQTGITLETPDDIQYQQWWKFMVNVGVNHAAAILRAPYRHFQKEGPAREIAKAGMWEVIQIANRKGISLGQKDIDRIFKILESLSGDNRVSMLQDVDAGRTTEVEILAGEVIKLGKELNIPTPVNEVFYHALKHMEDQYA